MKTNPIIPIWLMIIICIILLFLLIYNKSFWKKISKKEESIRTTRQKKILKSYILDVSLKILIIIDVNLAIHIILSKWRKHCTNY